MRIQTSQGKIVKAIKALASCFFLLIGIFIAVIIIMCTVTIYLPLIIFCGVCCGMLEVFKILLGMKEPSDWQRYR